MAATILHTIHTRVFPGRPSWPTLTQFERHDATVTPTDHDIALPDRPPMRTVPGYRPAIIAARFDFPCSGPRWSGPLLPSATGRALTALPATSARSHPAATYGREEPQPPTGPQPRPARQGRDATVPAAITHPGARGVPGPAIGRSAALWASVPGRLGVGGELPEG